MMTTTSTTKGKALNSTASTNKNKIAQLGKSNKKPTAQVESECSSDVDNGSEGNFNSEENSELDSGENSELDSEEDSELDSEEDSELDSEEEGDEEEKGDESQSEVEEAEIVEQQPKKKNKLSTSSTPAPLLVSMPSNLHETPSGQSNEFTVFVGNLPYGIEEGRLRQAFKACGTIREVRLVKDTKTKQCKGIAYVDFSSKEEHARAIETMHGQDMDGREIRVDAAASTKKFANKASREPTPILFVGNLSYSVTEKKLEKTFGAFGTVLAVRVPTFTETGQSKGYAYVQFSSTAEAMKAMQVPRFEVDGRIIRLDYDDGSVVGKKDGERRPAYSHDKGPAFKTGDRKPFGDKKPFDSKSFGERKPFNNDKKSFGKKSFGDKPSFTASAGRSSANFRQKRKAE